MKKIIILSLALLSGLWTLDSGLSAQVSTTPQKRSVLVEDFTGIKCSNCPDAHKRLENMRLAFPEQVNSVAIHYGNYARPSSDQPDFRTEEGGVLHDYFGVDSYGYPAGLLNRKNFGEKTDPVINRGAWTTYSRTFVVQDADVNIWAKADYDKDSRNISIDVELCYVNEIDERGSALCVALLQNKIIGPQSGSDDVLEYEHNHMLRKMLTPVWGDTIETSTKGLVVKRHYDYTLPEAIKNIPTDPFNTDILVYVNSTDDALNREVLNSKEVHLNCPGITAPRDVRMREYKITPSRNYGYNFLECYITNRGSETLTSLDFRFTLNGESVDVKNIAVNIPPFATSYVKVPADFSKQESSDNTYSMKLTGVNGDAYDGTTIRGSFETYVYAKGKVKAVINTDQYAQDNLFVVFDKDGNEIKHFGPYEDGLTGPYEVEFDVTQDNKMVCFEVQDCWGDGMLTPNRADITWFDAEGNPIASNKNIQGFGYRLFFKYGDGSGEGGDDDDQGGGDDDDDQPVDIPLPDFRNTAWGTDPLYSLQSLPAGTSQYANEYVLGYDGTVWMYTYIPSTIKMEELDQAKYSIRLQGITREGKKIFEDPGLEVSNYPNASWTKINNNLCANPDGSVTLAITDWRTTGAGTKESFHAYRFAADGTSMWPRDGIDIAAGYDKAFECKMNILPRSDGSNVLAWSSMKEDGSYCIERCHISKEGTIIAGGDDLRLGSRSTDIYDYPQLVPAEDDGYYLTYTRTSSQVLYVQKYNADGSAAWSDTYGKKIFSGGWGDAGPLQNRFNSVSDGKGGVAIGFNSDPQGKDPKPYISWVKKNGSFGYVDENGKPMLRMAYCDELNLMQYMPKILPSPDGNGFVAAIGHYNVSKGLSIQKVDSVGNILWSDYGKFLTAVTQDNIGYYSIQPGFGNQFMVAWQWANFDKMANDVKTRYAIINSKNGEFVDKTDSIKTLMDFQAYRSNLETMVHPTENYWVFQWQQNYRKVYSDDRTPTDANEERKDHYCLAVVTFDGTMITPVTGIEEVEANTANANAKANATFDLMGRKVSNDYRGVVIVNGRKEIRK